MIKGSKVKADPLSEELYELTILLGQAELALYRARSKELKNYGITPIQSAVMFCITSLSDKATLTNIALMQFRELNTTSEILKRMRIKGMVTRVNSQKPEVSNIFILTEKGHRLFNHAMIRDSIHQILSKLPKGRRKRLASDLITARNAAIDYLESHRRPKFPSVKSTE